MLRSPFAVAFLLAIACAAPCAQAQQREDEAEDDKPYIEPGTGLTFPVKIGDWKRAEVHPFDKKELGVGIGYRRANGTLTSIFIYNLGQKEIPADPKAKINVQQFEQAKDDIDKAHSQRGAEVKIETDDTLKLGDGRDAPVVLRAVYTLTYGDTVLRSHLYLTGYANHFIKVRTTYRSTTAKEDDPAMGKLLLELGKMIQPKKKAD